VIQPYRTQGPDGERLPPQRRRVKETAGATHRWLLARARERFAPQSEFKTKNKSPATHLIAL